MWAVRQMWSCAGGVVGLSSSTNLRCGSCWGVGPPFLRWLMWVISISNLYVVRALGGRASEARDSCFLHFEGITHFLTRSKSGVLDLFAWSLNKAEKSYLGFFLIFILAHLHMFCLFPLHIFFKVNTLWSFNLPCKSQQCVFLLWLHFYFSLEVRMSDLAVIQYPNLTWNY